MGQLITFHDIVNLTSAVYNSCVNISNYESYKSTENPINYDIIMSIRRTRYSYKKKVSVRVKAAWWSQKLVVTKVSGHKS